MSSSISQYHFIVGIIFHLLKILLFFIISVSDNPVSCNLTKFRCPFQTVILICSPLPSQYSQISSRWRVWNSRKGWNSRGDGKTENFNSRGVRFEIVFSFPSLIMETTGFIKTTDHRPTEYRPTDPPITYLPTFVKTEDQNLNMFCIL